MDLSNQGGRAKGFFQRNAVSRVERFSMDGERSKKKKRLINFISSPEIFPPPFQRSFISNMKKGETWFLEKWKIFGECLVDERMNEGLECYAWTWIVEGVINYQGM